MAERRKADRQRPWDDPHAPPDYRCTKVKWFMKAWTDRHTNKQTDATKYIISLLWEKSQIDLVVCEIILFA